MILEVRYCNAHWAGELESDCDLRDCEAHHHHDHYYTYLVSHTREHRYHVLPHERSLPQSMAQDYVRQSAGLDHWGRRGISQRQCERRHGRHDGPCTRKDGKERPLKEESCSGDSKRRHRSSEDRKYCLDWRHGCNRCKNDHQILDRLG